jgi:DNA-binding NarL/FixJ family response regulator
MSIKILIAEDQRLLRQCFSEAIDADPEMKIVATAVDGQEAVMLATTHTPDIILMDLNMPNLDGAKATKIIKERLPEIKVLMLSLHDEPTKVAQAMKSGVDGFISKDVDLDELTRIIKAIWKGEEINSPFLVNQKTDASNDIKSYGLSDREIKALKLLVRGESNSEIAEKLCLSEHTIKKEFVSIFELLGVKNRTQAAVKSVQLGLLADTLSD